MRGGRRRGTPGKSYSNRADLNLDRAVQPGSSAAPVPQAAPIPEPEPEPAPPSPDAVPNLTDPTTSPVSLPQSLAQADVNPFPTTPSTALLYSAMRADPGNPALRRIRAAMQVQGSER